MLQSPERTSKSQAGQALALPPAVSGSASMAAGSATFLIAFNVDACFQEHCIDYTANLSIG
jgi:hypothetical protein